MKNRKKRLSKIVVALLIVYTVGLPVQNIVLATEQMTNETVVTEKTKTKESRTVEKNTSNSKNMESAAVRASEETEAALEKSKVLTDTSDVNSSEKQGSSEEPRSATHQNEKRPSTK
ncbi:hypothetical protein CYG98_13625, partial [Listeria monocytogenes serotype 1/2a]|nr:hypothetical protein [Listeria monocytogenes serotype 1/2a]